MVLHIKFIPRGEGEMEVETLLIQGDCRRVMRDFSGGYFSAACFSPPYGVGLALGDGFDVLVDFRATGRFTMALKEVCRVSQIVGVNLGQLMHKGRMVPFQEELVLAMQAQGVFLFDRWVTLKHNPFPFRGSRLRSGFEFLLIFSSEPERFKDRPDPKDPANLTVLPATSYGSKTSGNSQGLRAYSPEMPRRLFKFYGENGPVLDPFCGTGTSLKEAAKLGIPSVGIELDPRIAAATAEDLGVEL